MVLMNFPLIVFVLCFVVLVLGALFGDTIRTKVHALKGGEQDDFDVVLSATLTLLGLLIGFSFSMAISRYDQRKNYEEAEANAIGTEYVRADFLPADDAAKVRDLLLRYLDERVLFYTTRDDSHLTQIDAETTQLHSELCTTVLPSVNGRPTPKSDHVVPVMNDV